MKSVDLKEEYIEKKKKEKLVHISSGIFVYKLIRLPLCTHVYGNVCLCLSVYVCLCNIMAEEFRFIYLAFEFS